MSQKSILIGFIATAALLGGFLVIKEVSDKDVGSSDETSSLVATSTASTTLETSTSSSTSTKESIIAKLIPNIVKNDSSKLTFEDIKNSEIVLSEWTKTTLVNGNLVRDVRGCVGKGDPNGFPCIQGGGGVSDFEHDDSNVFLHDWDYDNDGDFDVAVEFTWSGGGNGTYRDYLIFENKNGIAVFKEMKSIGGSFIISNYITNDNKLRTLSLSQKNNEPNCCAGTLTQADYSFGADKKFREDTIFSSKTPWKKVTLIAYLTDTTKLLTREFQGVGIISTNSLPRVSMYLPDSYLFPEYENTRNTVATYYDMAVTFQTMTPSEFDRIAFPVSRSQFPTEYFKNLVKVNVSMTDQWVSIPDYVNPLEKTTEYSQTQYQAYQNGLLYNFRFQNQTDGDFAMKTMYILPN